MAKTNIPEFTSSLVALTVEIKKIKAVIDRATLCAEPHTLEKAEFDALHKAHQEARTALHELDVEFNHALSFFPSNGIFVFNWKHKGEEGKRHW